MSVLNLKNMTLSQKFMAMEELWEDISKNSSDESFTPQWHKAVLALREKQLAENQTLFENFDDAKDELLKQFSK